MDEPRRPIFGFLWPRPDPNSPVDAAYRQTRAVRITPRGPIRLAVLVLGSLAVTMGIATVLVASLTTPPTWLTVVAAALCATALFLVLRGWIVGTYVSDERVRIDRLWRRTALPWGQVREVRTEAGRQPWLGLPIPVRAQRVVLVDTSGAGHGTHVYTTSLDLWLRPEAFDIAALRLERWRQELGGP